MLIVIPNKAVKTAVSLPAETFQRAEALRRKEGKTRSALYAEALEAHLKALEVRELEARYEAGYRKHPETEAELAEIDAFAKLSAQSLEPEDW